MLDSVEVDNQGSALVADNQGSALVVDNQHSGPEVDIQHFPWLRHTEVGLADLLGGSKCNKCILVPSSGCPLCTHCHPHLGNPLSLIHTLHRMGVLKKTRTNIILSPASVQS